MRINESFFFFIVIIAFLVISRLIPHPPNFTPILSFAIMAPIIFNNRLIGVFLLITSMFISDTVLGFHSYQFVVYLSIIFVSLITPLNKNVFKIFYMCFLSSIWFFISTNFTVWLMWDFYTKDLEGLLYCYTLAIPFFKYTILSTLIFTGLIYSSINYLRGLNEKINNFSL